MTTFTARLTYTPPGSHVVLYTLPFEYDHTRATNEGFYTGFYTLNGAGIGFEVLPDDQPLDPDPTKVVSNRTPHPNRVHRLADHDCGYTACGNLPVASTRRRRLTDSKIECVPCRIRSGASDY